MFGGHSHINTTLKHYADKNKNYTEQISMRVAKDDKDMLRLQKLGKTDLLMLIERAGIGTVKKLVNMINDKKV